MAKVSKKVFRSNRSHANLSYKHDKKQNEYPDSSKVNFTSLVKRNYHDEVSKIQEKTNSVLSSTERKKIFNACKEQRAYKNYSINEFSGTNRYLPKELEKKFDTGKKPTKYYSRALGREVW